tara:strand:- start:6022 stop:6726 length:705 start_codon:yes stop_codon:yes gene_type:complete
MNNFSIVIPVYNEQDNIEDLIDEIYKLNLKKYNYEIIIVDDCSTDKTNEILTKLKKIYDKIIFYKHTKNLGQSYAFLTGIKNSKFKNIITIDGDCQNDPKDIISLCNIYFADKKYDLVGGLRTRRKDTFIKIISSLIANKIRATILKDKCIDTGCSLKIFNKEIFLNFPFFDGIHRFLPALFLGYGYNTYYLPVSHRQRMKGKSNYGTFNRLFWGIKDIIRVKKILNKIKKNHD